MWLINIRSMSLEEFTPPELPAYAILSHTWEHEEVTFQEFGNLGLAETKAGAELSEAINSMFEWYKLSTICFAYLSDLTVSSFEESPTLWLDEENRHICRWFKRGWTLQELLAPANLEFYDSAWNFRGLKTDIVVMRQLISMTGIRNRKIFESSNAIQDVPVGERMSWASKRQTKRLEDLAYSLLGIFQVNMPMLYGEGMRSFQRLQEEIMKTSTDMSLFCWRAKPGESKYRGLLAHSPSEFASYYHTARVSRQDFSWISTGSENEFLVTNKGIRIDAELLQMQQYRDTGPTVLRCNLPPDDCIVLIPLRHYRDDVYVREKPDCIFPPEPESTSIERKLIYVARDVGTQMSEYLHKPMNLDLAFMTSLIPKPFKLTPLKGWPTRRWGDHMWDDVLRFPLTSAQINTCVVTYQLTREHKKIGEFVAICQKHSSAVPPLRYAIIPMSEADDILRMLEENKEDLAIPIIEKLIIAGRQTVEIESEIRGLNLFVSKYSPKEKQEENTLYVSLTTPEDLSLSKRNLERNTHQVDEIGLLSKRAELLEP
ncbi:hypothetical protein GQX73_g8178 [Xylaria multiplex]|uniref:Heterokaryon incompatibility domain-containing protein n=1 Tax=Xylaria multiplex TaxID=323545 RepID=A0A7C8MQC0_9PEZI|nr:hypothetical protein GQX73_g8178 [Xylaria multiplex]